MAQQPAFDFVHPPKQMADTSLQVYREIAADLSRREEAVLSALRRCLTPPTAYELFEQMHARHEAVDLNSVRPRLTALLQKRRVRRGERRTCHVTGRSAYTWEL